MKRHTKNSLPVTGCVLLCLALGQAARAQEPSAVLPVPAQALTLKDAVAAALSQSISLRQSRADADADSASARSAHAQTKPGVSTTTYVTAGDAANILTSSPGVMPQNVFGVPPRGFADQNLMLMVPLFTGGKLGAAAEAAQRQGDASAQAVRAMRLTIAQAVTQAYAQVLLRQSLAGVAEARLTAEDEQVRVTQERVGTGRLAPIDLLREQAEDADARQAVLEAQNNTALALVELKAAMGMPQTSALAVSDTLDGLLASVPAFPSTIDDALRQAAAHRPELAAAAAQMQAAQAGVRGAQGAYAPQVYGVAMGDASAGRGIGRVGYTVGVTASLPLYDAGQRQADVDRAKARVERARADAQGARQEVEREVASAWLTCQTSQAQLASATVGVAAARQGYDLAILRYTAGKSLMSERLDALAALVRAQGTLTTAKASLVAARSKLEASLGGP